MKSETQTDEFLLHLPITLHSLTNRAAFPRFVLKKVEAITSFPLVAPVAWRNGNPSWCNSHWHNLLSPYSPTRRLRQILDMVRFVALGWDAS